MAYYDEEHGLWFPTDDVGRAGAEEMLRYAIDLADAGHKVKAVKVIRELIECKYKLCIATALLQVLIEHHDANRPPPVV